MQAILNAVAECREQAGHRVVLVSKVIFVLFPLSYLALLMSSWVFGTEPPFSGLTKMPSLFYALCCGLYVLAGLGNGIAYLLDRWAWFDLKPRDANAGVHDYSAEDFVEDCDTAYIFGAGVWSFFGMQLGWHSVLRAIEQQSVPTFAQPLHCLASTGLTLVLFVLWRQGRGGVEEEDE